VASGQRVRISPPLTATKDDVKEALEILEQSFAALVKA
jgi:4-aminobutyrate aminotransferase-like enzyme